MSTLAKICQHCDKQLGFQDFLLSILHQNCISGNNFHANKQKTQKILSCENMTSFVKSLSCCNKWLHPFRRGAILCLVSKKDFCCGIAIMLKRPKRISAQEAVVMLTRLSEDDPTGKRSDHSVLFEQSDLTQYAKWLINSSLSNFRYNWLIIRCFSKFKDAQRPKLFSHVTDFLETILEKFRLLSCRHLLHCCTFVEHMEVEIFILTVFGMNCRAFRFFPADNG